MNSSTQILVIGGGPAGSTTATFLAREGFDVTLIEKEVFPRYHIGESLLPSCLEILELLGEESRAAQAVASVGTALIVAAAVYSKQRLSDAQAAQRRRQRRARKRNGPH